MSQDRGGSEQRVLPFNIAGVQPVATSIICLPDIFKLKPYI